MRPRDLWCRARSQPGSGPRALPKSSIAELTFIKMAWRPPRLRPRGSGWRGVWLGCGGRGPRPAPKMARRRALRRCVQLLAPSAELERRGRGRRSAGGGRLGIARGSGARWSPGLATSAGKTPRRARPTAFGARWAGPSPRPSRAGSAPQASASLRPASNPALQPRPVLAPPPALRAAGKPPCSYLRGRWFPGPRCSSAGLRLRLGVGVEQPFQGCLDV